MNCVNGLTKVGLTAVLAIMIAIPATRAADEANNNQAAQAQDQQAQDQQAADQQAEAENGDKQRRKLRIIELEHRDPQQLTQVFTLWDQIAAQGRTAQTRAAALRAQGQQPQDGEKKEKVAIAMDNEKKLLFVRGTEEQLEKIQALVDAVDVEDEGLQAHDFADHRLIPIPGTASGQVQATLNQLDLAGRMIQLGDVTLIAYRVDDEDEEKLEQAEEVINKLAGRDQAESDDGEQAKQENDK